MSEDLPTEFTHEAPLLTARTDDGTLSNPEDAPPRTLEILSLSLPAILNDASPYVAAVIEIAMLGHSASTNEDSTERLAAFAAVSAIVSFAVGLFNFLTTVVMARVAHALGGQRWKLLRAEVTAAALTAVFLGGCCAGLLYVTQDALLGSVSAVTTSKHTNGEPACSRKNGRT